MEEDGEDGGESEADGGGGEHKPKLYVPPKVMAVPYGKSSDVSVGLACVCVSMCACACVRVCVCVHVSVCVRV